MEGDVMLVSKVNNKNNCYKLKGSLKKNGIDCWRYFFYGTSRSTDEKRCFYIELMVENPAISPDAIVLNRIDSPKLSEEDLQRSLLGIAPEKNEKSSDTRLPSFVVVRSGVLGNKSKQLKNYFKFTDLKIAKKGFDIKVSDILFTDSKLQGKLSVPRVGMNNRTASISESGNISWNLNYERLQDSSPVSTKDDKHWFPSGIKIAFSGEIILDDEVYSVSPKNCFGYADKNWGKTLCEPFFHISSSKLTSIFSGKCLQNACFTVQGPFDNTVSALIYFDDESFEFGDSKKYSNYEAVFNCIQTPNEEKKLHWSVSLHNKNLVLDIDIFCTDTEMVVRDYELPYAENKILKILTGVAGTGEIRLYKKSKKSIELIQDCIIDNTLCEYGCLDS